MPTRNLRQGRIKVRSGDSVPLIKTCAFTEGDFSFTQAKNTIQVFDRGKLDHLRRGDEAPVDFSFSAKFVDKTLRRCLAEHVWDGQTESLTGLTGNQNNPNVAVAYPFEQGSLGPASGETAMTSKQAHGVVPSVIGQYAEEVGVLDVEDVTVVGSAAAITPTPGEFAVYMPIGDTTLDVTYDAVGQSTLDPATSDVKTFDLLLEILSVVDPSGATVDETYLLSDAVVTSVEQAEGDEYDTVSFSGFAYVTKPTIS